MVAVLGTPQGTLMESPQTFSYPFYQISQDFGKVFTTLLLFHNVVRWLDRQSVCIFWLLRTFALILCFA